MKAFKAFAFFSLTWHRKTLVDESANQFLVVPESTQQVDGVGGRETTYFFVVQMIDSSRANDISIYLCRAIII
jgi:hypothetical protein